MRNVAFATAPVMPVNGQAAAPAIAATSVAGSGEPRKQQQLQSKRLAAPPPLQNQQQRPSVSPTSSRNPSQQKTNSELFEIRQRQLLEKREEVTWETSSLDRERGRMVRSLNVVERNRLLETQRQLAREMEQRMRDIRQEQTAVLTVRSVGRGGGGGGSSNGGGSSHQDLLLLVSEGSSRSHSGGTARFF